jgi:hypothetical protein
VTDTVDHEARANLHRHEDVCGERYGSLWSAVTELKATLDKLEVVMHGRLNTISNRIWAAVVSALGLSVVGLAGMVMYLLTRTHA